MKYEKSGRAAFLQRLTRAVMAAFLALIALAAILGGAFALVAAWAGTAGVGAGDSFVVVFAGTLAFGAVPALFLGAPGYAWMWHKGRASWLTSLVFGAALGAPWCLLDGALGAWAAAAGAAVALATHAICRAGAYRPSLKR